MERRLAAVLIADVVGYGRLSQIDEEGTRAQFQADLHEVFEPALARHHGRLVKTMGDGLLMEFASVVDAVRCAVELQRLKAEINRGAIGDRHLVYRVGINLGDVIVEGDDIHGDGVNLAERLQGLADPGGVMISAPVYDQVKAKVEFDFEFLGEQRVKNVAEPMRVYRIATGSEASGKRNVAPEHSVRTWRWPLVGAAASIVTIAAGMAVWISQRPPSPPPLDSQSIIVLPFTNMSGDPEQEYFADGFTEDLTTDLSQISGLSVISRNTAFAYKGKAVKPSELAADIHVDYVLEGSVRRNANVVRINVQLIRADSEIHTWANRYDEPLSDIFSLQDKVTRNIVEALKLRLSAEERLAIERRETTSVAAYDAFLRGWELVLRGTGPDLATAVPHLEEAIRQDPAYGRAYAALAQIHVKGYNAEWALNLGMSRTESRAMAYKYLEEAQKHPTALSHQVAALMLWIDNMTEEALNELQEAVRLNPGDALTYAYMAGVLTTAGKPAEALPQIQRAMQIDPLYPSEFMHILAMTQFAQEKYEEAAASLETAIRLNPGDENHFLALAATYGHLGRKQEAMSAIARYNAIRAGFGAGTISVRDSPRMRFRRHVDVERFRQGLLLAGVPETPVSWLWGSEFRKLLFGHRIRGSSSDSLAEYTASFTSGGIATFSGAWGSRADGIVTVEEYQICIQWPNNGQECANIFRNAAITATEGSEFTWLNSNGAYPFSVVD